jgi:hypothetical protein
MLIVMSEYRILGQHKEREREELRGEKDRWLDDRRCHDINKDSLYVVFCFHAVLLSKYNMFR